MNQGSCFRRTNLHRVVFAFLRNSELNYFRKLNVVFIFMHLKFLKSNVVFAKCFSSNVVLFICIVCVALVAYCRNCFFADITPFRLFRFPTIPNCQSAIRSNLTACRLYVIAERRCYPISFRHSVRWLRLNFTC